MHITSLQIKKFVEQLQKGQLDKALSFANDISQKEPDHPKGYTMLGDALMHKGEHELATNCYKFSLEKKPDQPAIYIALGEAYLLIGETGKAYEFFYKALTLAPENADILQKTGNFLVVVGRLNDAKIMLEKALSLGAKSALQSLLDLKIHIGDREDIKNFIDDNWSVFQSKVDDLTYIRAEFSLGKYDNVINLLSGQRVENFNPSKKSAYHNLLGSSYEKIAEYDKAFTCFREQNESKNVKYSNLQMEQTVQEILSNTEKMDVSTVHYKDVTDQQFSPLFVIGLPRSGTSLLEQILNTSEHVVAGGELLFVEAAYKKYFEKKLSLEEISQWYREKIEFITKNQEFPKEAPRWLTDKLPSNFINIGFIKKMIPDAKFLYCNRNPMDNGLSIYRQNFLSTHSYATNLENIAHFISTERQVMEYWLNRYPEDILTVNYEELVYNFNPVTQQIFEFADLGWNEDVKYFYKNNHYCNTASFDQVRNPVNSKSIDFHQKYSQQLLPLKNELKKLGVKT